ncbi:MAG: hypothetical protein HY287_16610 [Planctomycetes bacterium]|nr:hypothetical protein [Planctomycetota bacterium]MBI3835949.1 hypothetical protein [Planctomycetota bacterium]
MGSALVTGSFNGTVDFDPGPGEDLHSTATYAPFVTKILSDGKYGWTRTIEPGQGGIGESAVSDADGFTYFLGIFAGPTDFDVGPNVDLRTPVGHSDIFLTCLSPFGDSVWTRTLGGISDDSAEFLSIANDGSLIVSGSYRAAADLDPGCEVDMHIGVGGASDAFFSRYVCLREPADANNDQAVDMLDFARFETCLMAPDESSCSTGCGNFDLNGNGLIDVLDLPLFLSALLGPKP